MGFGFGSRLIMTVHRADKKSADTRLCGTFQEVQYEGGASNSFLICFHFCKLNSERVKIFNRHIIGKEFHTALCMQCK